MINVHPKFTIEVTTVHAGGDGEGMRGAEEVSALTQRNISVKRNYFEGRMMSSTESSSLKKWVG